MKSHKVLVVLITLVALTMLLGCVPAARKMAGTPVPQAILLGAPSELAVINSEAASPLKGFFAVALDKDSIVGATNEAGQINLYIVDLTTGLAKRIAQSNPGLGTVQVSGQYVVWDRDAREILAYDMTTNQEKSIGPGTSPDVSGNIVVWVSARNFTADNPTDIFGYDLKAQQPITVVIRPGMQGVSRISDQWVAYLEVNGEKDYRLRVHNITTNDDFEIGAVPVFTPQSLDAAGRYFALHDGHLAWVSDQDRQLHIYDLNLRVDQTISIPNADNNSLPISLELDNGLLAFQFLNGKSVGWMCYDLASGIVLTVPVTQPSDRPDSVISFVTPVLVSNGKLVWETTVNDQPHLYTSDVTRSK